MWGTKNKLTIKGRENDKSSELNVNMSSWSNVFFSFIEDLMPPNPNAQQFIYFITGFSLDTNTKLQIVASRHFYLVPVKEV